jgi:septum formation protein
VTARTLVLASTSPRRRLLLKDAGYTHAAISPGLDDAQLSPSPSVPPHHWSAALAYLKARAALEQPGFPVRPASACLLLAADTIVVKRGRILGHPMTETDARSILTSLDNGEHTVITGVALLTDHRRILFTDAAHVRVGLIGRERLDAYIASGLWRGKAGAYNLAERLADHWPIEYTGDPATIMGLPIQRLRPLLDRFLSPRGAA